MKYADFQVGDTVLVVMPKGSGQREVETKVVEKGADGIVLLERRDGRRFFTNAHRIKEVTKTIQGGKTLS